MLRTPGSLRAFVFLGVLGLVTFGVTSVGGQVWLDYQTVTNTNIAEDTYSQTNYSIINDGAERDYEVLDVDLDGDMDVLVVRKEPFTTFGNRQNILLLNVDGVLTDKTFDLAPEMVTSSEFPDGDNARDVKMGNFNGDAYPDFAIANAGNEQSPGQQPRLFFNRGVDGQGVWLGFEERSELLPYLGIPSIQPNACAVGVGDVTGNGYDDLYIVDYLNSVEDKLLINSGVNPDPGDPNFTFYEETDARLPSGFETSAFATAGMIADLNSDGFPEIIKNSTPNITIAYNNSSNPGFFSTQQGLSVNAAYHFDVGDLDGDNRMDIFVVQDPQDRYLINNSGTGQVPINWGITNIIDSPLTGGFGGNVYIRDMDADGDNDVVVTDVDTDVPNCSRRMAFLINDDAQNPPIFDPYNSGQYIAPHHFGTYDVAIADFNNDGVNDLLVGHCGGTDLYYTDVAVPVQPVTNLACVQDVLDVDLTWTNNGAYDQLEVRRDGVVIATLPGGTTSYTDAGPGSGNYSYTVAAQVGQEESTRSCVIQVSTVNPVTALTCEQIDSDVVLNWTNGGGVGGGNYDFIQITRNGAGIDLIPGTQDSYVDQGAPDGIQTYGVIGLIGADQSAVTNCTLTVIDLNVSDLIIALIAAGTGATDSAGSMQDALTAIFVDNLLLEVSLVSELQSQGLDLGNFERIWIDFGTFPNNHSLLGSGGQILADYVNGGGKLFMSGGDTFCFDNQTAVHALNGIGACSDGPFLDVVTEVEGIATTECGLLDFTGVKQTNGEALIKIDNLTPLTTGTAILSGMYDTPGPLTAAVINQAGGGKIISQSVEVGTIGVGDDKEDLLERYISCFDAGPVLPDFIRGDANYDGSVNVADAVTVLDVLFSSAPVGDCEKALDFNDSGAVDVADAVYGLEFLFNNGPDPISPFPSCGPDGTADGLPCVSYTCP